VRGFPDRLCRGLPPAPTNASATTCRPPVSAPSRRWLPLPVARRRLRVVQGFVKRPMWTEPHRTDRGLCEVRSACRGRGEAIRWDSASRDANAFDRCQLAAAQDLTSDGRCTLPQSRGNQASGRMLGTLSEWTNWRRPTDDRLCSRFALWLRSSVRSRTARLQFVRGDSAAPFELAAGSASMRQRRTGGGGVSLLL
jgi:hypothetical protein